MNSKGFTSFRYYSDDRLEEPDALENSFGKIENFYPYILAEIKKEQNLSEDIRHKILMWLFIAIKRSPVQRETTFRLFSFTKKVIETTLGIYQNEDLKTKIKQDHIASFYSKEALNEFLNLIISCQWKILKAPKDAPFITNDNPGFSINTKTLLPSYTFQYTGEAINHFIFSPKYCLEISWFYPDTPIELNALDMEIEFFNISKDHTHLINKCVIRTAKRWILAHDKEKIEKYTQLLK